MAQASHPGIPFGGQRRNPDPPQALVVRNNDHKNWPWGMNPWPPEGEPHTVYLRDAVGAITDTVTGRYYPYAGDLPGGYMLVPVTGVDYSSIQVAGFGPEPELFWIERIFVKIGCN